MFRRLTTTAALVGIAAALTACGADNPKPQPVTSSGSSSSSATPEGDAKAAGEAAIAAYRHYIEVADNMAKSGGTKTADLPSIAAEDGLTALNELAADYRTRKVKATGPTEIRWTKVISVEDPVAGKITGVYLHACLDTTTTAFVNAEGKAIRGAGTITKYLDQRSLDLVDNQWKVVDGYDQADDC
ncbi:hypothetical protein E1263_29740 [Kribbella antibiotica]|uniref:Lipoprotein n=1 Tax=Kribbella antibiotica TaxID=190195 RepID=A0A4R4Z4L2_9ACTN|nr:hypothetical protein [Kribbella antibiotica]TDD51879.1 hypothetical protein E1263_29740 [Kribbella antibiotica]